MTAKDVYWMSLVAAYNQAVLSRDMSYRTTDTLTFTAWCGGGLAVVLVLATVLGAPNAATSHAVPLAAAVVSAVLGVIAGVSARSSRKTSAVLADTVRELAVKIIHEDPAPSESETVKLYVAKVKACAAQGTVAYLTA